MNTVVLLLLIPHPKSFVLSIDGSTKYHFEHITERTGPSSLPSHPCCLVVNLALCVPIKLRICFFRRHGTFVYSQNEWRHFQCFLARELLGGLWRKELPCRGQSSILSHLIHHPVGRASVSTGSSTWRLWCAQETWRQVLALAAPCGSPNASAHKRCMPLAREMSFESEPRCRRV